MAQVPGVQPVDHRRNVERGAGVAGPGLVDGVDREEPQGVDRRVVDVRGYDRALIAAAAPCVKSLRCGRAKATEGHSGQERVDGRGYWSKQGSLPHLGNCWVLPLATRP